MALGIEEKIDVIYKWVLDQQKTKPLTLDDMPLGETVSVNVARRMLTEKGYQVKSHKAFYDLLDKHGIKFLEKRHRIAWFSTDEINSIPRIK